MLKLYYAQGASSLAPHIALREAGLPFALERVNLREKTTSEGTPLAKVHRRGYVPILELPDGRRVTEVTVILRVIDELAPGAALMPAPGSAERIEAEEWLAYTATELHKGVSPLFASFVSGASKEAYREVLQTKLTALEADLRGRDYVMGDHFTLADAYLFPVLGWTRWVKVDLGAWPGLVAYSERMRARPAVRAALDAEKPQ